MCTTSNTTSTQTEKAAEICYLLTVGLLATLTMDVFAGTAISTGLIRLGPYRIIPNLLGRWVGCFAGGRFFHNTILETQPLAYESPLGVLAHYLIGLTLTAMIVYPHIRFGRRTPSFRGALLCGLVTCVFPCLVMFPAMGFGVAAWNLPHSTHLLIFSALNHAAYGTGIFLWSRFLGRG